MPREEGASVLCIGRDANGELGSNKGAPILTSAAPIKSIGAGLFHSFAIGRSNELYLWGAGSGGQLGLPRGEGNATFGESSHAHVGAPLRVRCGTDGVAVVGAAAGRNHSLALTQGGNIYSWGRASEGQLGHGESTNAGGTRRVADTDLTSPKLLKQDLPPFGHVACGEHFSAALSLGGIVHTWGCEHNGQTGRPCPHAEPRPIPRSVFGNELVSKVALGWRHALCITQAGKLYSWGCGTAGQLGRGAHKDAAQPGIVQSLAKEHVTDIAAGRAHSLAISSSGLSFAFGDNELGQCGLPQASGGGDDDAGGDPSAGDNAGADDDAAGGGVLGTSSAGCFALRPQPLTSLLDCAPIVSLSAGAAHSCFVTADGRLYACGDNSYGQLGGGDGNGSPAAVPEPRLSSGLERKVLSVACGAWHSVLLLSAVPVQGDRPDRNTPPTVAVVSPQDARTAAAAIAAEFDAAVADTFHKAGKGARDADSAFFNEDARAGSPAAMDNADVGDPLSQIHIE